MKTMAVRIEVSGPYMDLVLEMSFLLLEMLGLKEKALTPDDAVVFSHNGG